MYFSEYHFKSKTMKLKRNETFFISLDNIKYFACSTWKVPSTAQVNYGKTKHFTRLADINWKPRCVNSQGPCSGTKIAKRCLSNSSLIFCFGLGKKPLISQLLSQMQNRHSKLWNYRHDASHAWWNIAFNSCTVFVAEPIRHPRRPKDPKSGRNVKTTAKIESGES